MEKALDARLHWHQCLKAVFLFIILQILVGCSTSGSKQVSPSHFTAAHEVLDAISSGPKQIDGLSRQLSEIRQSFRKFDQERGERWRSRGYMDAQESNHIEMLLFRFTSAQDALTDLSGALGGKQPDSLFSDEKVKAAAHTLVTAAQFLLIAQRAEVVAELRGDKVVVAKLNEAFPRSEIPSNSFNKLQLHVTSRDLPENLQASWVLFEEFQTLPEMKGLVTSSPTYAKLATDVTSYFHRAKAALEVLQGRVFASKLTHSRAADLLRRADGQWGNLRYQARCGLFKNVSRIKNPLIKVIDFSHDQFVELKRHLQPGDIILTYTAGYMSDVFIPGRFKHGITYIGSPQQRLAAGLDASHLPGLAKKEQVEVAAALQRAKLDNGKEADVIEAVAEGVVFNSLEHIMDTHVNRLTVLRPKISATERVAFLAEIFSFHGDPYDFLFDFADASRQVCTEVIYRGLDGKSGIELPLAKRGGHPTLSADDLLNYHFSGDGRHFEVIAYAEQDSTRPGRHAALSIGAEAEQKLRLLMTTAP